MQSLLSILPLFGDSFPAIDFTTDILTSLEFIKKALTMIGLLEHICVERKTFNSPFKSFWMCVDNCADAKFWYDVQESKPMLMCRENAIAYHVSFALCILDARAHMNAYHVIKSDICLYLYSSTWPHYNQNSEYWVSTWWCIEATWQILQK
jgi:hypothetical protein